MSDSARLALAAARPYVSAASNTGGGAQALRVLKLIDQTLAELRPKTPQKPAAQEGQWEPPGGWPEEQDDDAA